MSFRLKDRTSGEIMSQQRFSWNPEWMGSLTWMDTFTIPLDQYLDEECEDPDADTDSDFSEEGWDDVEDDDWVPFFANVCKSITHATPWSNKEFTNEIRREILKDVTARFIERCNDQRMIGRKMKVVLSNVQKENKVANIQSAYIAFMDGQPWKGYDTYRDPNNFYRDEDWEEFKDTCTKQVQYRLHMINTDWSRKEARISRAIDVWNEVTSSDTTVVCGCFGGPLTIVLDRIRIVSLTEGQANPTLPNQATCSIQLLVDGQSYSEAFVRRPAVYDPETRELVWDPPQPAGLHLGLTPQFSASDAVVRINLSSVPTFCCMAPQQLGFGTIPLGALYTDVLPLNHEDRQAADYGIHFIKGTFRETHVYVTGNRSVDIDCRLYLQCLETNHCQKLPPIDIRKELENRRKVHEGVNSDIWMLDHHAAFIRLADLLGELNDTDCHALKLYADRFLVDDELYEIAIRVAAATRGKFSDPDFRELVKFSAIQLKDMRPNVKTKMGSQLIDDTLTKVRKQCVDRILALEDVTDDPYDAADAFIVSKEMLAVCGVQAADLSAIVEKNSQEMADVLTRKVKKLIQFIHLQSKEDKEKEGGGNPRSPGSSSEPEDMSNRLSALFELDARDDKAMLVGKSKVLYDLVDRGLSVVITALQFAQQSGDKAVIGVALVRSDTIIQAITPCVQNAVLAVIAELAQSFEPDPLGDTFGILTLLYSRVMETVDILEQFKDLRKLCLPIIKIFDSYLPGWFSLCRNKVYSWVKAMVREEPLQAILPGKAFCNQAPSDVNQLVESLSEVFQRCLQWAEEDLLFTHVTSFAKLSQSVSDESIDTMFAKGNTANSTSELCCAMSTLFQFQLLFERFWNEHVFEEIVHEIPDPDKLLFSQIKLIRGESMAHIQEIIDQYSQTIQKKMRQWTNVNFNLQGQVAEDVVDEEFCQFGYSKTVAELELFCNNLSVKVANDFVLPHAVAGIYSALNDYVIGVSTFQLRGGREKTCQLLLSSIDKAVEDVCSGRISTDDLFDHSRRSRGKLKLAQLSTDELIDSITQGDGLSQREREQFLEFVRVRKDPDAIKFMKQWNK